MQRIFQAGQGSAQSRAMISNRVNELLPSRTCLGIGRGLGLQHGAEGGKQARRNRIDRNRLQPLAAFFIFAPVVAGNRPDQRLPRSQRAAPRHLRQRQNRILDRSAGHRLERGRQRRCRRSQGMLRRQRRNRPQCGKIVDTLPDEAFDPFPVSCRKIRIGERRDNLLQLVILRAYLPADFRQSR